MHHTSKHSIPRLHRGSKLLAGALAGLTVLTVQAKETGNPDSFPRLKATAFRIMPETHNRESAYASIAVADNDKVYLGPAMYGTNAFLVELDPSDGHQRIVVDTQALCELDDTGFAAQSKIHTRICVASSGCLYFGSKQGYRKKHESRYAYRGGYLMRYDPATDTAHNLGKIPFRGHGVYDVMADERRGLLHVTTCADELGDYFWFLYDLETRRFEGLGPKLHVNAHPLVDPAGRVYVLTHDGKLARYDPDRDKVEVRDMMLDSGKPFAPTQSVVQCEIAPDGTAAYFIPIHEPVIYAVDLEATGDTFPTEKAGTFAPGPARTLDPCFAPDGRLYLASQQKSPEPAGARVHISSYDPRSGEILDHGALEIANPEALRAALGKDRPVGKSPFHGLREAADGALVPRYVQGISAARDGTLYVMTLYPLSVLRIEGFKAAPPP